MNPKHHYHGWLIELVPESTGYSFQCLLSEQEIVLGDRKIYPTREQALTVAQTRADLEAVSLALIRFLNEIHGHCYYLSSDDHIALTASILEFVESGN